MKRVKRSRTNSAIVNIIFNTGYQVINSLVNLVIPPLIIARFGSSVNGLIQTIRSIINYVSLIGSGIADSTVVSLYKPLADEDEKGISAIFNASAKSFWQAGIMFCLLSTLLAFVYPFFVDIDMDKVAVGAMVLILCVAGASEFFVIGKCRTLLQADQRVYVVNIAQIIGAAGMLVATVVMIQLHTNILIVQLAASTAYILRLIILSAYVKRNYTFIDRRVAPDTHATSRRKAATIHQLAGLVIYGSQTIVVSKFLGFAEGSVYATYALVFTGINTILSTLSSALLANFGDIMANESNEKITRMYELYEFVYFFLIFSVYAVAYIMILPFIDVYLGGTGNVNYYIRPSSAMLFCVVGVLNCLRTPGGTLIHAIGHYAETKNRALIEMTICFVGEIILVNFFGINGVILGTMAAFIYRSTDIIFYSNHRILKRSVLPTYRRLILSLLMLAFVIGIAHFLPFRVNGFISWIFYGGLFFFLSIFLFTLMNLVFYRHEVIEIWVRVKGIVYRK